MAGNFGRVLGGATSGIGRALGALAMGDQAQQQAYDGEMAGQSKIAQALAQVQQAQAAARLHDAQAADKVAETQRAAGRPALVDAALAAAAGVDVPTLSAYRQKLTTGQAPQVPMGPPAEDGGMGLGSAQFSPEVSSKIGQALQRFLPLAMAEKDVNPEQWAKAQGLYRGMDLGDQVLGGQRTAADVGRAQAAVEAKPLYNSDASGAVLDLFGGGLATDNPMAQGTIALRGAQAGAQKANAAQSYAAADSSRASAARTRMEMEQGAKGTYDPTRGVLIDPRAGTSRPVMDVSTGKPLGAAARTGPMSATLQKELLEADDAAQSSQSLINALQAALRQNDKAYSGYFAKQRATLASNVPGLDKDAANATIDMDNLMVGQGLESLKSIFGAAPTEGERKILMDMQASVDKTPEQRRAIIERAVVAAQRRGVYASNKAKAIREGTYLTEGVQTPQAAPAGNQPPAAGPFSDAEKERRYQVWKANQEAKK